MKILVVSGFLGAGKTTFISTLAKMPGLEFVVMENEYGSEGIDGALLQQDRLKVWELTEGCICCSLKGDFASSILTVANTLNPEYLVVEPTGVGLLSSIMHNISKIEYDRIKLLQAVTIVDIHCIKNYLERFSDIYIDQIKCAKYVVLSKLEGMSSLEKEEAIKCLKEINPCAMFIAEPYQNISPVWWKSLFESLYTEDEYILRKTEKIPNLQTFSLRDIRLESVNDLLEFLVAVLRGYFGYICRAKGYLKIINDWTRFDVVDMHYSVALCEPMNEAKAVFIGENIQKAKLKAGLSF